MIHFTDNVTHQFFHTWKVINGRNQITQIDSGNGETWATGPTKTQEKDRANYMLQNGNWVQGDGYLSRVTVGKSGVWGVNRLYMVYFREGITSSKPIGTTWSRLADRMVQIDAGSSGVVYAVNRFGFVFSHFLVAWDMATCMYFAYR